MNNSNSLDYAIDQYINALLYQQENYGYINSYSALISLSALDGSDKGKNEHYEEIFLQNIKNGIYGNKVKSHIQRNSNGVPAFYHISTNECKSANYRIYLNCKAKNVASLADAFARELKNDSYYFKFNSNQSNSRRSEQFVFYINEKNLNIICQKIQLVRQKYPRAF